jgi:acyl-CoA thioesterase-1
MVNAGDPGRPGLQADSTRYWLRIGRVNSALAVLALGLALCLGQAGALAGGAAAEPPLRILAFGDSLTAGLGLSEADSFPGQLEQALRAEGVAVEVVNAGVSGDTTAGGLARLDWALGDDPDLAIVELGANDALRGLSPDAAYRNLNAILEKLDAAGVDVLLTGMLAPPNLGREYEAEFNQIFPRLAEDHDVLFYPFFLDGVAAEPSLLQDDGMHPNAAGVAAIVRAITPYVLRLIAARG